MARRRSRSLKGIRAVCCHPVTRGKNITVVGAIRRQGPVVMRSFTGAMTGRRFLAFCQSTLFPRMKRRDTLVLDNLRAHHHPNLLASASQFGIKLLYLPPYCPSLNPIEFLWAAMKGRLRGRQDWSRRTFPRKLGACWRAFQKRSFRGSFTCCIAEAPLF